MAAKHKWRVCDTADVRAYPPYQNTPRLRWEARTWREYQLALVLPMRFAEHTDDRDISATIAWVANNEWLPWEYSEQEWEQLSHEHET